MSLYSERESPSRCQCVRADVGVRRVRGEGQSHLEVECLTLVEGTECVEEADVFRLSRC